MAMDFFEQQHLARKKTGRLVVLFAMAVGGIVCAAYLVVAFILMSWHNSSAHPRDAGQFSLWEPQLLLWIGGGVILLVGAGTLYKLIELRAGGRAVAESLGGKLIEPGLAEPQERKLLNVVEEMAIASGTPVPPVYLLPEESGINAFAAGFTPADAVVGATQGAVDRLSRDELQGVIAHEFSHILNGDMRLNIRLMGILHGILVLGLAGYFILRSATYGPRHRSQRSKGNPLPFIAIGIGLMVVGYVGTFFGKLIKSAVSRQREFLADAASVQFTRNPGGLVGALRKIGGLTRGSLLVAPNAETASHMFFGQGVRSWLGFAFSTHPDLKERIRRIEPAWDGTFISAVVDGQDADRGPAEVAGQAAFAAAAPVRGGAEPPSAVRASHRIGRLGPAQISHAARLVGELPEALKAAAREPFSARALIYALLVAREADTQSRQLDGLRRTDAPAARTVEQLLGGTRGLRPADRLPLVEMAMPALRRLSAGQFAEFARAVEQLVRADGKIGLFEWMIQQVVLSPLKREFARSVPTRIRYYGLGTLGTECGVLLSTLAYAGHADPEQAATAFAAGAEVLPDMRRRVQLLPVSECGLSQLDSALTQLAAAAPRIKRSLLDACAAVILADAEVKSREAELLRAVAACLDCPMPPLAAIERE